MSLFWVQLLSFLVAVCLLVTVHEFGHFWVARRLGFKVLRFSVGFGKPLWKRVGAAPDHTEYVIAAVPLGGYVKMLDEREGSVAEEDLPRSFTRRPHWQRIAVLLAGPAFNIIFAIVLLTGIFMVSGITVYRPVLGTIAADSIAGRGGLRTGDEIVSINSRPVSAQRDVQLDLLDAVSGGNDAIAMTVRGSDGTVRPALLSIPNAAERRHLTEPAAWATGLGLKFYEPPVPPVLGTVEANGPAARAGLLPGDRVLAINGIAVHDFLDFQALVQSHPAQTLQIQYQRGAAQASADVLTTSELLEGKHIGRIHVAPVPVEYPASLQRHLQLSLPSALAYASGEAWSMTSMQGRLFWRMLMGQVSMKNLAGPLTIARYAGDSAAAGMSSFLSFLVIISLALGFMNLLPIPILDGGQIVFQAVEWLKGSPLSERVQIVSQQLGVALLVLLMGVALYNDISPQFG